MAVFVAGGTGFIGSRLIRLLVARGQEVVCMDINPIPGQFDDLNESVKVVRGDITQFDDVMGAMTEARADRAITPSYFLDSYHAPHRAMRLNVLGMDNFFEAARLCQIGHVVYVSS